MQRITPVLTILGLAFLAVPPADAADAVNGQKIAAERCARCHDIGKGGAFKQRPPTFQAIAIYRTSDDIWGRIIAPSPHVGMPDVAWILGPDEVQDLVAYITSLDVPLTLPQ